jgi:hypothetical protein
MAASTVQVSPRNVHVIRPLALDRYVEWVLNRSELMRVQLVEPRDKIDEKRVGFPIFQQRSMVISA